MAAQCFQWSDDAHDVKEFYAKFGTILPQIVTVEQGFYGSEETESFGSGQVIRIQTMERFTRVLGSDCKGRMLSIPIDYPMKMQIKRKRNKREELFRPFDQSIADIIMENKLPVKVQFSEPQISFVSGRKEHVTEFGPLELQQTFDEKMLLGNIITVSEGMSQTVVQVAHRTGISLRVAVALADGSRLGFDQYMDTLTEAIKSIDFDTTKFNNEISVYYVDDKTDSHSGGDLFVPETSPNSGIVKAEDDVSAEWFESPDSAESKSSAAESDVTNLTGTWSSFDTELPKRVKSKQRKARRSLSDTVSKYFGKFFTSTSSTDIIDKIDKSEIKSIDASDTEEAHRPVCALSPISLSHISVDNRGMYSLQGIFVNPSETEDYHDKENEAKASVDEKLTRKKPATLPKPTRAPKPKPPPLPNSIPVIDPTIDSVSVTDESPIPSIKKTIDHDSGFQERPNSFHKANMDHQSDGLDSPSSERKPRTRSLPIPCPLIPQRQFSDEYSDVFEHTKAYQNLTPPMPSHTAQAEQPEDIYETGSLTEASSAIYDELRCDVVSLDSDKSEKRNYVEVYRPEPEYETTVSVHDRDFLKKDFSDLTMRDISQCLIALRLEKYVDSFLQEGIDGEIFKELDKETLKNDLGMSNIDVIKITKFVQSRHIPS